MGRPPSKFKTYSGDAALEKILATKLPENIIENENAKLRDELLTMRRHFKGGLLAIDKLLTAYKPKCESCYSNYGYLSKCICNLERKAGL
jgi:hypothetical protein